MYISLFIFISSVKEYIVVSSCKMNHYFVIFHNIISNDNTEQKKIDLQVFARTSFSNKLHKVRCLYNR